MAGASQALTTGMKVLGGGNVAAYTLEHLTNTRKHPAGSFDTIIIPYIELGRAGNNAVSFGDDMATVSRKHAAIERSGNDVVLKSLSTSNATLVNGRIVKSTYFLQNGDEIQLSAEGPRMRFNLSSTGTAQMGVTRRMNLVMQQAVRPYRAAVVSMVAVVILLSAVGGFFTYQGLSGVAQKNQELDTRSDSLLTATYQTKAAFDATIADMKKNGDNAIAALSEKNTSLKSKLNSLSAQNQQLLSDVTMLATAPPNASDELTAVYEQLKGNVYFMDIVKFNLIFPDGSVEEVPMGWLCTGFLIDNGNFVTARHCVQGWRFQPQGDNIIINALEQAGVQFDVEFRCTSPTNQFTFRYKDFLVDDSHDIKEDLADQGMEGQVMLAGMDKYDWAYVKTKESGGLKFDEELSKNMKAGSKVFALGYTNGFGGSGNTNEVSPLIGEATVAQNGLTAAGNISVSNKGWGSGNSGGPLFTKVNGEYKVVGIVSWSPTSMGIGDLGFLVPIAEVP